MKALKLFLVLVALVAMVTPTLASEPLGLDSLESSADSVSAASVSASELECVDIGEQQGSYVVCFLGVDYNDDGTSTWTYSLTVSEGTQALSHVAFATCESPMGAGQDYTVIGEYDGVTGVVGRTYPTSWGQDSTTFGKGVNVFKFDETQTADGETEIFQFTMSEHYGLGSLTVGTKSGVNTGVAISASITGPDCTSTVQPTPEPTNTPEPPATNTPEPNDTPEPTPTNTPEPTPTEPATAVTLKSFTLETQGNVVVINWETATETDNAGFNIYRVAFDGTMTKVNDTLIGATADAIGGSIYSITDTPGFGTFTYVLEDIDFHGVTTQYDSTQIQLLPLRSPLYRPSFVQ